MCPCSGWYASPGKSVPPQQASLCDPGAKLPTTAPFPCWSPFPSVTQALPRDLPEALWPLQLPGHLPHPDAVCIRDSLVIYPVILLFLCHLLTAPVAQSLTSYVNLGESLNLWRSNIMLSQVTSVPSQHPCQVRGTAVGPRVFL